MNIKKIVWIEPDKTPAVPVGTEKLYWLAVEAKAYKNKAFVFLAYYQNRELDLDDEGLPICDDHLVNIDGEAIESIGWVERTEHEEFDSYYTKIKFCEDYKLLGWAEYEPPLFTGF